MFALKYPYVFVNFITHIRPQVLQKNDLTHELKLTEKLDTFKSRLKTKLFKEYYE